MTFKPGISGNLKGRPPRQAEERLVKRLAAKLSNGEFDEIVDTGIRLAKRGDVAWARLLMDYAVGKPRQQLDVTADVGVVAGGVEQILKKVYGDTE